MKWEDVREGGREDASRAQRCCQLSGRRTRKHSNPGPGDRGGVIPGLCTVSFGEARTNVKVFLFRTSELLPRRRRRHQSVCVSVDETLAPETSPAS